MNYEIVKNREEWNKKIGSQQMSQFLQSFDWGLFNEKLGIRNWKLGIGEEFILILIKPLLAGYNYLYVPRTKVNLKPTFFNVLKQIARDNQAVFIRYESSDKMSEALEKNFKMYFGRRVKDVQPSKTLFLDLSQSEAELLNEMHPKTRYNIRLAEKKGVSCRQGTINEFDQFWKLIKATYKRQGIAPHSKEYYLKMLQTCDFMKLYFAEYENKIIVANLVAFFGDTVTYVHGGSDNDYKNVMAPHLLQWYQIQLAKAQGYKYYDFHGIDEIRWPGITRFKRGFGGFEFEFAGCWDLILNKPFYYLYEILRKINFSIRKVVK